MRRRHQGVGPALALGVLVTSTLGAQEFVDLPAADVPLEPGLEEVYTVGSLVGDEWETFSRISSVAFDAAGNLYILDADNFRVVVVDPNGWFLREMGHEGGGPGEFRMPLAMAVAADGTVTVLDLGNQAFVVFDGEGDYEENYGFDLSQGIPGMSIMSHPEGGVLASSRGRVMMPGAGPAMQEASGMPINRYPLRGDGPSQLFRAWEPPPTETTSSGSVRMSGGSFQVRGLGIEAFRPQVHYGVQPDGSLVVSDSTAYALKVVRDGQVQAVLRRPLRPRAVTSRDQEAEKERRLAELDEAAGPRMTLITSGGGSGGGSFGGNAMKDMMRNNLEKMSFFEEVSVVSGLAVDWDGRLWVERTGARVGDDGPTDVLSADGGYLGTISADGMRIPSAFGPDGLVANVETDELDVPSVRVSRLDATIPG